MDAEHPSETRSGNIFIQWKVEIINQAVPDIPVADKDLQQCADAIMRLRVEYFLNQDNIDSICFKATDGTDCLLQGG